MDTHLSEGELKAFAKRFRNLMSARYGVNIKHADSLDSRRLNITADLPSRPVKIKLSDEVMSILLGESEGSLK